ncbi:hypothetical protein HMPREF0083_02278 [Aneurinibacillus aneurinilyticus ATCC 12856]|uniref:Uncharacterized protein n=1 Tax=Aneurinibacillus aneurinilyticus ATCC 12856 TaxID=649747 RepID=U1X537_ANEAE|nr:hypothetical protein HMPREF0083_02278 [Aneurinibacillus aneurinilyticus ATCC 12856]
MWETNRRPFGTRWGDDTLWNVRDNQHPWCNLYRWWMLNLSIVKNIFFFIGFFL